MINEILEEMPWGKLFEGKSNEECTEMFINCIKKICLQLIPKKNHKRKSRIPRVRKNMLNRIKMLKRKKKGTRNKSKIKRIENSIIETEISLQEHRKQEKNMIENPKLFYDYIRKQKDRHTRIGPFKIGKDYI